MIVVASASDANGLRFHRPRLFPPCHLEEAIRVSTNLVEAKITATATAKATITLQSPSFLDFGRMPRLKTTKITIVQRVLGTATIATATTTTTAIAIAMKATTRDASITRDSI